MKTITVCPKCGSPEVLRDAFVAVNNTEDVRTFDALCCDRCGYDGSLFKEVEVADDFDIEEDTYSPPGGPLMAKVVVHDLRGKALDWAAAQLRGMVIVRDGDETRGPLYMADGQVIGTSYSPSQNGAQAWELLAELGVSVRQNVAATVGYIIAENGLDFCGPVCPPAHPELAVTLCYVAYKNGEPTIEVPEELLSA